MLWYNSERCERSDGEIKEQKGTWFGWYHERNVKI